VKRKKEEERKSRKKKRKGMTKKRKGKKENRERKNGLSIFLEIVIDNLYLLYYY
jgi:hypothetical protein